MFHSCLKDVNSNGALHPMSLHLRYIRSSLYQWRDYLNYLSSELHSMVGHLIQTLKNEVKKLGH
jgi:hypothetical protein